MRNAAAHSTYAKTQSTSSPRDLEAHLLLKSASKSQSIKDGWEKPAVTMEEQLTDNRKLWSDSTAGELSDALIYNRKLWTIFVTSVTSEESQLPTHIRENIANLGLFVFKRTLEIEAGPQPQKLNALIEIDRNVAAGLRSQA